MLNKWAVGAAVVAFPSIQEVVGSKLHSSIFLPNIFNMQTRFPIKPDGSPGLTGWTVGPLKSQRFSCQNDPIS